MVQTRIPTSHADLPAEHSICLHVFIRVDYVSKPLQQAYEGQGHASYRHEYTFKLNRLCRIGTVSDNRLKVAYVDESAYLSDN